MSGGVDSSVAAALLMQQGYEVVGVTLHLWDYPDEGSPKGRCCAPEDVHDAKRVADQLGFPHYAFDRRELFEREVVAPFVEEYLAGTTPSPCVRCNRGVKVAELLTLADRLSADFVATGHYARLSHRNNGEMDLLVARDATKDQSYFLHMLPDETLRRFLFPLGDMEKASVREKAVEMGLPGAGKGESQELCFVPTGRYDRLVEQRAKGRLRPGPIVDREGRVVGTHGGMHKFTLGQRRNLGVAVGERAYVVELNQETSTVRLGLQDELGASEIMVEDFSLRPGVSLPLEAETVIRYRGARCAARITLEENAGDSAPRARVAFSSPVSAPNPGQFAVFYDGDKVLGGGLIVGQA